MSEADLRRPPTPQPFQFKTFSVWAGVLVVLLGCLTLAGWIFNVSILKTVFPRLVSMKPSTAICFILSGTSLLLQIDLQGLSSGRLRLARALVVVLMGVSILTLVEYIFNIELGFDQILFRQSAREAGDVFPGRMSPATALDLVLLGAALLTLDVQLPRSGRWLAQDFTLVAAVVTLLAFIGYFYGVETLYQIGPYSTIALHTVLAIWLLCLGILFARPDHGVMAVFTSDNLGGLLARRMLPAAILMPLLAGWLRVVGQRAGFYGLGFGSALYATVLIVTFTMLVIWAARALNRADAERRQGAEALSRSNARLDGIISSAMDAVISVDSQQRIILFNPAAELMFRVSAAEALGENISHFIPERFRPDHPRHIQDFAATEKSSIQIGELGAISALRANGEEFPAEASVSQVHVGQEKIFTVVLRDITERKRVEAGLLQSERREHARRLELEALMQELSLSRENLRGLAARLQAVREEERTRVAREIHDVLAQELTRLKMDITWLNRQLAQPLDIDKQQFFKDKLARMSEVTDIAITSVQRIATELRPVVLDSLGLCAAVEWQAKDFEIRTGIACSAAVPEMEHRLDRDRSTALFRILQESLTNIARHAQATRVEIDLSCEDDWMCLYVRDNGCGIRPAELSNPKSVGLLGMRERAALLGGQCVIQNRPDGGTAVEARLPFS